MGPGYVGGWNVQEGSHEAAKGFPALGALADMGRWGPGIGSGEINGVPDLAAQAAAGYGLVGWV